LRNPYVLDKAMQIPWSEERLLPQSEREFRALFWQEIVRVDHRAAGGMPRRREAVFVQIALRRARALTLYAGCADLDAEVIAGLQRDSLIVSSRENAVLVAPAHDVLEDWAILRWIDEQYATHHASAVELSATLGTHPAVRRTYRKWVSELVERDPETADELYQAVVREAKIPAQFRDDTLASLLRSPSSAAFLERHRAELFANDKQILRRVIHLLRVACVTTPSWLEPSVAQASLFNVPDGPAWACVLRLLQANLVSFSATDRPLILGFIEDWARGVSWQCPYPDGAESVAAIAHWLLPNFEDYCAEDQRKRALQVIAKIPNADPQRFATLIMGNRKNEERLRAAEEFRAIVLEGMEGMPAARAMPEVLVSIATEYLLCSEDELRQDWGGSSDLELETLFGIKYGRSRDFFPASAYRGPLLPLLRYHPRRGLDFIIGVFNHSAEWYAHPRVRSEYVEPPVEMELTFSDGTSRTQWCNDRLWNLYRGTSVGPCALQSLLMALERWLLEFAEARPRELDGVLLQILRQSNSAALAAVVASVATAFPHSAGEALLVLLRSAWCILLDWHRLMHESQALSRLPLPRLDSRNKVYEEERKEADASPHRSQNLETTIANLQLGSLAPRVREILDQHRAAMPQIEEQEEADRLWRLAIHRMDLRQYTVAEEKAEATATEKGAVPEPTGPQQIRLDLKPPDPDVKEMVDHSTVQFQAMNARLGLMMWGMKVFRGEESARYDPAKWREPLVEARTAATGGSDDYEPGHGGPGYIAAVCVRDHWEEMADDERDWCVNRVCSEVVRTANHWNQTARVQRYEMAADRPCAKVVPLLLGKLLPGTEQDRVRQALVAALTHAIDEVRWYAAWGIGKDLWAIDRELTLRCVNALAMEARLVQESVEEERSRIFREKEFHEYHGGGWVGRVEATAAHNVRRRFFEENGIPGDALQTFDPDQWFGAEANGRILAILAHAPNDCAAIDAFRRLGHTLVAWWDADEERRRDHDHERRPERRHQTESAQMDLLQNFVLRTTSGDAATVIRPLVDAVDRHPDKVHWFLLGIIGIEDRQPNTEQFWFLWNLFAEKVRRATWLAGIDEEHASGREMMSAIFLGTRWKEEVRHWRSVEVHAEYVHALFEELPASSTVLDNYVRLLHHVGEQSLPNAFVPIMNRLQQGNPGQMLRKGNTVYLLELLLQRFVYGRPLELKRQNDLRDAVLGLLDMLVENGSSAAFRMRDDFVTPLAVA